jgi:hypothetical protein
MNRCALPVAARWLDDAAWLVLQQQGLTFDSVPELGQPVKLRLNSNLSTGGAAIDVTDLVHPSNRRVAELAAQFLALDVAGIDIVCYDIRVRQGDKVLCRPVVVKWYRRTVTSVTPCLYG